MAADIIGTKIQNYRVVRQVGRGGMGNVYEARHEQIDRRAAIKVLHPEFARDAEMAQRFLNEARAANVVGHPGLVNIFELGTLEDGAAYIIMEFLEGESLRARIRRPGGCQPADALRIARQIAGALQAVHAKGIIHRDLKPDNIILVPDFEVSGGERAKVLDFGIAKLLHGSSEHGPTHTGAVVGTPAYMAPEQCGMRMPVTDRTDVYALGIMLFEMLAGKPPFVGEGPTALIGQHLFVDPPPLPEAIAPETAALVMKMLAKTPAERPAMSDVVSTLSNLGDFSRISRLDISVAAAVAAAAQASGEAQVVAVTTMGQSAGERKEAPPSSSKRGSIFMAAVAAVLLVGSSSAVWWTLRTPPAKPGARPHHVESLPSSGTALPAGTAGTPQTAQTTQPTQPLVAGTTTPQPPLPATGSQPTGAPVTPAVPASTVAETAASCQALYGRKRYVEAIAACTAALALDPNQPAVKLTLRNAAGRLAPGARVRPPAGSPVTEPKAATGSTPTPTPTPTPVPTPVPTPPPTLPKDHYEKVTPIE